MPGPSNSSFIPKRGPVKQKRAQKSRQVYIFTIISYVLLFATLLATGGVFLYGNYIDRQLDNEIAALNREISSFSERDMQRVLEFDLKLSQAASRIENSVSLVSLLGALEAATIDTVQLERLSLERVNDTSYTLAAAVQTDSFDSTIFQRDVFQDREEFFTSVTVDAVETLTINESTSDAPTLRPLVTFTAALEVPITAIPYVPSSARPTQSAPIVITDPATEALLESGSTSTEEVSDEDANSDAL